MKVLSRKIILNSVGVAAAATLSLSTAAAGLEKSLIWSSYDLGSSGYAEATAIADALQKNNTTRIRILPSGTSVGRILPLKVGKAKYGFLANEVYFATEGLFEFSDQSWGPQDLRFILGRPAVNGIATAANAGIKNVKDLRGKKIGYVEGNPSVNVKTDAQLAYGGLTRDDVEAVYFGSYGALGPAFESGQIDARNAVPTSSVVREMEASSRGLYWVPFNPENKDGWQRVSAITDFQEPVLAESGAGLNKENPVWLMGYRYPMITTYAKTDEEDVYQLVKAIDEAYGLFKNATAGSGDWMLTKSIRTPADAPWHEGAIRYAKEKGLWTERDQTWQEKRLARLKRVKEAWALANVEFKKMKSTNEAVEKSGDIDEEWKAFWVNYRIQNEL